MRYTLALTMIPGIGSIRARYLIQAFGNAQAIFEADDAVLRAAGPIGQIVIDGRHNPSLMERAEREMEFIEKNKITTLIYGKPGYPHRLLDCPDAPTILFKIGRIDLECPHVISIVGTRQCTQYGRDNVHKLVKELHEIVPDAIIISGLALGIDVESHKSALENNIPTLGVMAHGLDRIYPFQHRDVARQMVHNGGGLITEYVTRTEPARGNFLARNRIIAGLADAVVVAESKDHGGSLVTAAIGLDYGRDIFAIPGRCTDERSNGCNRLIRLNRAGLITNAQDLVESLGWKYDSNKSNIAVQQTINFEEDHLSLLGRKLLDILQVRGDLRLTQLCELLPDTERAALQEELLDLELSSKVRVTPGGLYQVK